MYWDLIKLIILIWYNSFKYYLLLINNAIYIIKGKLFKIKFLVKQVIFRYIIKMK